MMFQVVVQIAGPVYGRAGGNFEKKSIRSTYFPGMQRTFTGGKMNFSTNRIRSDKSFNSYHDK
jgi:hypothetical protein